MRNYHSFDISSESNYMFLLFIIKCIFEESDIRKYLNLEISFASKVENFKFFRSYEY